MDTVAEAIDQRVTVVQGLDDPRIADYLELKDGDLVRRRGAFVVEGEVVLRVQLEQGRFATRSVFIARPKLERLWPLLAKLAESVPVYTASAELMDRVVGLKFHRGIVAVGERAAPPTPDQLLTHLPPGPQLIVGLEGLTNHENVGGIFRNAAAFGASVVLLDPRCCDPLYRKAIRVSVGAGLAVPFGRCPSPEVGRRATASTSPSMVEILRRAGFTSLALTPRADAVDLTTLTRGDVLSERVALLFGTEGPGLSDAVLEAADHRVRVAMPGSGIVDSLNVGTTSGIALHELWLARRLRE